MSPTNFDGQSSRKKRHTPRQKWEFAYRWVRCGTKRPPKAMQEVCLLALRLFCYNVLPVVTLPPWTRKMERAVAFPQTEPDKAKFLVDIYRARAEVTKHIWSDQEGPPEVCALFFLNGKRDLLGLPPMTLQDLEKF